MATQQLETKDSMAMLKTAQGKESPVEVLADRVILSMAVPRTDGQWEEYPKNYSVWKRSNSDLYAKAQLLKDGQEIWVKWTEKPAPRGAYRDIVAMGRSKPAWNQEPTPIDPAPESSEAIWNSMGASSAPAAPKAPSAPTVPAAAPSHPNGGNDAQRASIEAQVAAKIASEILRDMLTTVDGTPESKLPIVRKLLPELTMIARAAIHEASQG